jgi:eukaryotic-like serine/threonine-protein kinase
VSLSLGTRLGPYEVTAQIGAGGMGEVYRARDTRLDRTVAIKVLPTEVAGDTDLRSRFEREARAVAALDHPHICGIYDVGSVDGTHYLVMPHLDGQTLAARLEKGPLPLDQALTIATEIADALDKAHRHGITHRDLKPANIMLTKAGSKLLDFGLAKLKTPTGPISMSGMTRLGTAAPATAHGTILGTVLYMAPEQLEGKDADARSDIWALGAVIYEMIGGARPFKGDTPASIIGAILKDEPRAITEIRPLTPPLLDHIVRRCLAKDPEERWQTAADLKRDLKWIGEGSASTLPAATAVRRREGMTWSIASLAVLAVAALSVPTALYLRGTPAEPLPTRFDILTPPTGDPVSFALSLDGRQLAFVATAESKSRLWVRPFDDVTPHALAGTEGASFPFWKPDGKAIGFFADGKLKRIDLGAGTPQVLADAPAARGGTWSQDGVIVFAPSAFGPLMRVAATGGTAVAVTRVAAGDGSHRWPQMLPDGRHFLFFMGFGRLEARGVYVGTLDGGESTRVLPAETAAVYSPPSALLVVQQGVLVALRFDPTRGTVSGQPIPVVQGVGSDPGVARGAFSVSATGVLAHRASGAQRRQLVWVDRTGTERGAVTSPDENALGNPELAPDGKRVAVQRAVQSDVDVWLIDIGRGVPTRFTFDAGADGDPLWSPDGSRVVFRASRKIVNDLFERPSSSVGAERLLLETAESKVPLAWSHDGRFLLYASQNPNTGSDLWALSLDENLRPSTNAGRAHPVVQTGFDEWGGQFSPNGRWVAYESNESGPFEVYIRTFPDPGGQWRVSTAGGTQPRWRLDGKELFYVAPDARLMAVPITVGRDAPSPEAGTPVPLFATRLASGSGISAVIGTRPQYAVAADGRFLMNVTVEAVPASPITVVLNWDTGLETRSQK